VQDLRNLHPSQGRQERQGRQGAKFLMSLLSLTSLYVGGASIALKGIATWVVPFNYFFASSSVLAMEARMSVSAITFFIL
jgi:hypothetical protein